MPLPRRLLLILAATAVAVAVAAPETWAQAPAARRPNVLLIFGDDIGQANVSAYSRAERRRALG